MISLFKKSIVYGIYEEIKSRNDAYQSIQVTFEGKNKGKFNTLLCTYLHCFHLTAIHGEFVLPVQNSDL